MSQPAETRDGKVRVPDPDTMGIRVNGPADGWLTDQQNAVPSYQWGDYDQHSTAAISTTSFWVGQDSGWGMVGPGSWSGDRAPYHGHHPSVRNYGNGWILAAVERATAVLRNPIVSTPWVCERTDGSRLALPLWITDPMLCGRTPGGTSSAHPAGHRLVAQEFWESLLTMAIWWGRGAFVFMEAADGQPLAGTLRLLNPYMVGRSPRGRWVLDPAGEEPLETDFDGRFEAGGRTWRICVVRGLSPMDSGIPEGVLVRHWPTLRMGAAVNKFVEGAFRSGVPSGFLKVSTPNIDQAKIDKLKADWESAHGTGRRSTAVLNATVDYTPISISPVDAQADKQVSISARQIAWAFTLDAVWLNEGTSGMNYNNNSDRRSDLLSTSSLSWGNELMQWLTALLPYGTGLRVDWKRFAAPSLPEMAPAVLSLVQAGVITPEEARAELGFLNDHPGGV